MEWWKAILLGTLVYVGISSVLSVLVSLFGVFLALIPIVGTFLILVLNLTVTFAEAVFSGFIAGNLTKKNKMRVGFVTALLGSIVENFIKLFLFTFIGGIIGAGALLYVNVPVEFLIGGGVLGSFFVGLIGAIGIIVACFGGYLGAKVSLELPLSRVRKELKKKIKV